MYSTSFNLLQQKKYESLNKSQGGASPSMKKGERAQWTSLDSFFFLSKTY